MDAISKWIEAYQQRVAGFYEKLGPVERKLVTVALFAVWFFSLAILWTGVGTYFEQPLDQWWTGTIIVILVGAFLLGLLFLIGKHNLTKQEFIKAALKNGAPPSLIAEIQKEENFTIALAAASPYLTKEQLAHFTNPTNSPIEEPTPTPFEQHLWDEIIAQNLPVPPPEILEFIKSVLGTLKPETAAIQAAKNYLRYLPKFEPAPFTQPLAEAIDIASLTYHLVQPFRDTPNGIPILYNRAVIAQTAKQNARELVYPQSYQGPKYEIPDVYFSTSPLKPLLDLPVPLPLNDKTRFEHHHILGARGKGKTTFLSHLIDFDIKRVPDISVVVLDSQFRLIDGFAHLPNIDPIVIGPRNPLPINPFKWGNTDDVVEILTYAFGSIFQAELTQLQTGPLEYIIRAVAQDPNANLDTLVQFIVAPHQELIDKTDANTQLYFKNFYRDIPRATRSGIVQRIMGFRRHAALDAMLNAPTNELNLPAELQNGRIILIDTNKEDFSSEQTHVFGRLFIALLHNVMRKRTKSPEEQLKPVFVYIDELADYCPAEHDDVKFRELLDQSRKQRMGFIVAHQREDQINMRVLKSLQDSSIITHCRQVGFADMSIYGKETRIPIKPFQFSGRVERQVPQPIAVPVQVQPTISPPPNEEPPTGPTKY